MNERKTLKDYYNGKSGNLVSFENKIDVKINKKIRQRSINKIAGFMTVALIYSAGVAGLVYQDKFYTEKLDSEKIISTGKHIKESFRIGVNFLLENKLIVKRS